jgi:hypothetical protein
MKINGPTKSRGPEGTAPAFYRNGYKSIIPSLHHDTRKRDEPIFSNPKWRPYKKK